MCGGCKFIHEERGEKTPCGTCVIEPFPANEDALKVYSFVRWQTVTTEHGEKRIVDIDVQAVMGVMDLFEVKDKKTCLIKTITLFHHFFNK
jgi:hypothetical protein